MAINAKTDHPLPPSHQLLAQWIVQAWDKVPEELVCKSWEVCGYKSVEDMSREVANEEIVNYSPQQLDTALPR